MTKKGKSGSGESCVWVPFDLLERFMADVFTSLGVPPEEARMAAEVLSESDRRGIDSHGIARFKQIYVDRIRSGQIAPVCRMEIVRESPTTAVIDGHNGLGLVIARKAMEMAMEKASRSGMGMSAVRRSNHYGIAGYYALMATKRDQIGITGTNARPSIAPTFSVENMLGTNPLCFGLPTDEPFPFILDCATSVSQRGKIEMYARRGKAVPSGWVVGRDGRYRHDAKGILKDLSNGTAALTPLGGIGEELGGHKGYGYAAVVEILSSALQAGAFLKAVSGVDDQGRPCPHSLGHFFVAIDIAAFTEPAAFKKTAGDIVRSLRAAQKAPGEGRIYTAGEKEYLAGRERENRGARLELETQNEILLLKEQCGLSAYHFPFEGK